PPSASVFVAELIAVPRRRWFCRGRLRQLDTSDHKPALLWERTPYILANVATEITLCVHDNPRQIDGPGDRTCGSGGRDDLSRLCVLRGNSIPVDLNIAIEIILNPSVKVRAVVRTAAGQTNPVPVCVVDFGTTASGALHLTSVRKVERPGIVRAERTAGVGMNNEFEVAPIRGVVGQIAIRDVMRVLPRLPRRANASSTGNVDAVESVAPITVVQFVTISSKVQNVLTAIRQSDPDPIDMDMFQVVHEVK